MNRRVTSALALGAGALLVQAAAAADVKIGFLGGFTGPIESLVPPIYEGAKLAVTQVNEQGGVLGGQNLAIPSGDTTCADATAAANAADRLVNSENVLGIVGALCSGATISSANKRAIPGGVVVVSPASTSARDHPRWMTRTCSSAPPSVRCLPGSGDGAAAEGEGHRRHRDHLRQQRLRQGLRRLHGRRVREHRRHHRPPRRRTRTARPTYRSELGSLASSGAETLVVLAYGDGSGQTIIPPSAGRRATSAGSSAATGWWRCPRRGHRRRPPRRHGLDPARHP